MNAASGTIPLHEIMDITEGLIRYRQDHRLMDQLTVTRGYAELIQLEPSNQMYYGKLNISLQRLSDMAEQRGLRSVTERIGMLGVVRPPGDPGRKTSHVA
jgi:hypothetical protein